MKNREVYLVDQDKVRENAIDKFGKERGNRLADFSCRLDALMYDRGISQETLASKLNVSDGAISNYRNARQEPKLLLLSSLADCLNVDCHFLLTGVSSQYKDINDLGLQQDAIDWLKNAVSDGKTEQLMILNAFFKAGVVDMLLQNVLQYVLGEEKKYTLSTNVRGLQIESDWSGEPANMLSKYIAQESFSIAIDEVSNVIKHGDAWHRKKKKENAIDDFLAEFEKKGGCNNGKA